MLGEEEGIGASNEDRVVVAETFDEHLLIDMVIRHRIDASVACAFFGDRRRMQRDVTAPVCHEMIRKYVETKDSKDLVGVCPFAKSELTRRATTM